MIVKLLGILDFLAAIVIVLGVFGIVPTAWLWYTAAYLAIKAIIFIKDWMSWIDLFCATMVILLALNIHWMTWAYWIVISYLFIKSMMSIS